MRYTCTKDSGCSEELVRALAHALLETCPAGLAAVPQQGCFEPLEAFERVSGHDEKRHAGDKVPPPAWSRQGLLRMKERV